MHVAECGSHRVPAIHVVAASAVPLHTTRQVVACRIVEPTPLERRAGGAGGQMHAGNRGSDCQAPRKSLAHFSEAALSVAEQTVVRRQGNPCDWTRRTAPPRKIRGLDRRSGCRTCRRAPARAAAAGLRGEPPQRLRAPGQRVLWETSPRSSAETPRAEAVAARSLNGGTGAGDVSVNRPIDRWQNRVC